MTDTGLNRRLRQHTRRSGPAVALTMVLATGLMIAVFIMLFAWLNPYLSDFISSTDDTGDRSEAAAGVAEQTSAAEVPGSSPPSAVAAENAAPTEVAPPPASDSTTAGASGAAPDFTADFQSNPQNPVNLRSDPGTNGTQIVEILEPGTPLQSLEQEEEVNGVVWRQFRTADGQVGWIREIDAESLEG